MPSRVFKPYAGVSTAVLIFTKGGATEKVWFYNMGADGYSLDDKRTFIDGKGDIPDIARQLNITDGVRQAGSRLRSVPSPDSQAERSGQSTALPGQRR